MRRLEHACNQQTAQTVPDEVQPPGVQGLTKRLKPQRILRKIQPHRRIRIGVRGVARLRNAPCHPGE